jgi:hypothetical protein
MNTVSQVILVGSNLALAAAVSLHVLKSAPPAIERTKVTPSPASVPEPLLKPIETLDQSVNRLTLTLQRFNTSSLQYEYLQKEIERLAHLDQTLAKRINLEEDKSSKEKTAEAEKGLKQLQVLQDQVQQELKRRRESVVRLIEGLERQLDSGAPGKTAATPVPENGNEPKMIKLPQAPAPEKPSAVKALPK